jgi:hypothetical protein
MAMSSLADRTRAERKSVHQTSATLELLLITLLSLLGLLLYLVAVIWAPPLCGEAPCPADMARVIPAGYWSAPMIMNSPLPGRAKIAPALDDSMNLGSLFVLDARRRIC